MAKVSENATKTKETTVWLHDNYAIVDNNNNNNNKSPTNSHHAITHSISICSNADGGEQNWTCTRLQNFAVGFTTRMNLLVWNMSSYHHNNGVYALQLHARTLNYW